MKMVYERDRIDNKFKDLEYGELFRFVNGKYPSCIFMKSYYPLDNTTKLAVNVDKGWATDLISDDDEIVRVEGVLTIK